MASIDKYINTITCGNNIQVMKDLPDKSIDMIFADPPYNLQLKNELTRPNQSIVDGVDDEWDKFDSFSNYDEYTKLWLSECKRTLKKDGTIWLIGSYHNIFRVGAILQELGFWILNDIIWIKSNPMPNFKGTRYTNAHETLIWAAKSEKAKYTFHYKAMKTYNGDKQMRSDWYIPICTGNERVKVDGKKAHSTQKPEELLQRIILSSSNVDDIILDPFMGSGTTAAVAKKLKRKFIGIEKEQFYVDVANKRLKTVEQIDVKLLNYQIEAKPPKVPFGNLLEKNLVSAGEKLFNANKSYSAEIQANASIIGEDNFTGSIHSVSANFLKKKSNNGWKYWYVERKNKLILIDDLRSEYIKNFINC